ncbi:MAG: zf-TFIIB domain-containing protein [Candidatus Roizmanbacteria bacterium]|nr:MAG: zf-TFIIB domain-containing protein [Candidatus Roizmanbacteria bacterium]
MSCPNCSTSLTPVDFHHLEILHCKNCGCTFFEDYAINRIDVSFANKLAFDKLSDYISGSEKLCPRDQSPLSQMSTESIPQDVQLLQCGKCKGIFAYPDDLMRFKLAQNAKINYFKAWNIPPALRSLLVLSLIATVSMAVFGKSVLFNNKPTKADDIVKSINTSVSGRLLFVSFRTQVPYSSRIIFLDKTSNSKNEKVISAAQTKLHYLVVSDIDISHDIFYQIIVTDKSGKEVKTSELKLRR